MTVLWENLGVRLPVSGLAVGGVFWVFGLVFQLKRAVLFRGLPFSEVGMSGVGEGNGESASASGQDYFQGWKC